MAKTAEVWRSVNGEAIRCTECAKNKKTVLTDDGIVGVDYTCTAKDEICVFLNRKIDSQEWYEDFHDIYDTEDGE